MKYSPVEPQLIIDEHLQRSRDALVFVGMGIGKTAACINRLHDMFINAEAVAALVVAPLRVANLTWPMEVKQWDQFRWMRVANLRTEKGQRDFLYGAAHIYTINYEGLGTLANLVERRGGTIPYDIAIFDELTRAKNPSSKRINFYRRGVPRPPRNWGLTGTPIPNSWQDLFAQVRLVDGGQRLGRNFLEFKRTYFFAPEQNIFGEGERRDRAPWQPKANTLDTLESKIADITVTLKSSDWLDIPDTIYNDIELEFTPELRKRYTTLEEQLVIELRKDKIINVASAAALVTKLLQFTSGHMYDDERDVHPIHNLKFDALKKIAKDEQQPLFVATIYQHEQARIRSQFPKARFFADAKGIKAQEALINDWNVGKIPMLVAHPASAGHGLNLQHGSSVIVWVSLTYSREQYEQMIARLARRGQEKIVKVYRLMVTGTVDEAVAEALTFKAENEQRLITALQMLESYRNQK
jgi:SNF2 family DNA or RNA helicase